VGKPTRTVLRGGIDGDADLLPDRATFLVGVEEGLIPHYRAVAESTSGGDSEALDEELRGLYVALTRARERLYLSACRQRSNGASSESRQPSRWLNALPADLIASA